MRVLHLFLVACLTGLLAAAATLGPPPAWFLTGMLALFMVGAMAYGFTGHRHFVPDWALCRPVVGIALFTLGLAAVFIPVQFVVSAYLTGTGIRLLWLSVSEQANREGQDLVVAKSGDSMTRQVRSDASITTGPRGTP